MEKDDYIWAVAYINKTFMQHIPQDLQSFGFGDIKFNIPTVKVLKKRFKGKSFYEEVPLLFNYGFFRIPIYCACDRDYLQRLKVSINGIYNWLYKSGVVRVEETHTLTSTVDPGVEVEQIKLVNQILVESVRILEIARLKRIALENSIYSSDDVDDLSVGRFIVLKGYPFDNIPAEVLSIHPRKESVKVRLLVGNESGNAFSEATVNFSNIFYSIYSDCEEPVASDNTVEGLIHLNRLSKRKSDIDPNGTDY